LNLKANLGKGVSSMVSNVIKNVVRDDWEISAKKGNASIVLLNKVSEFMRNEMNSMDYEAICMKNIAAHSQVMPREDLRNYIYTIQALETGYKRRYGPEVSNLLMVGVTSVARDPRSARKHLDSLLNDIYCSADACNAATIKESTRVQDLSRELQKKEANFIIRLLKKGEIVRIKSKIGGKKGKIDRIERKKEKYLDLAKTLKGMANPSAKE